MSFSLCIAVITPHVSFRNRGISKVAYMKEATGLGGSAMGILLMTRNKKKIGKAKRERMIEKALCENRLIIFPSYGIKCFFVF